MITVACVWVQGNVPYPLKYVTHLQGMVQRHLTGPFEFVCLTDRPWLLPGAVRGIAVPAVGRLAGWWAKVQLFNRAHAFADRVLYLDLDTVVVRSLDPIAHYPAPFALVPHAGTFEGRGGLRVVKRFNSSVVAFDRSAGYALFDEWTPAVAERLWGDQDWIGERLRGGIAMPASWFPRISELGGQAPGADAKVVLVKKPKNEEAAARWPWVADAWRAA